MPASPVSVIGQVAKMAGSGFAVLLPTPGFFYKGGMPAQTSSNSTWTRVRFPPRSRTLAQDTARTD